MIGLDKDVVEIYPYDKNWINEFEKEKKVLENILKDYDIQIEHVGSTSIPNLSAKPIIDIAIGTKDEQTLFEIADILIKNGYDVLDNYQTKGEILARKGPPKCRTHYIHMQLIDSEYWNEFIFFKRYLIEHPQEIKRYQELKIKLSKEFSSDRKRYTREKNEYISNILKKAYKLYK